MKLSPDMWIPSIERKPEGAAKIVALGGDGIGPEGVEATLRCIEPLGLNLEIERPLHGVHRPWTPFITQFVCRSAFRVMGVGYSSTGARMKEHGAVVANHSSWLDIFTLNAEKRVYFVSKAEVARWPAIGWLARATGTVFIRRDARDAVSQKTVF